MIVAGMLVFGFFIPIHGGICGPYNNPFGMNGGLQTVIWITAAPLFFGGIGRLFEHGFKGAAIGVILIGPMLAVLF